MTIKNLSNTPYDELIDCFLLAFENYFVPMSTDKNYFKQRWQVAGVDYGHSYGMFDHDKLVGFIIHAIDKRHGELTAFNTGTGVIPDYRGKRIVKSIYDHAIKDLRQHHINKSTLEVITKNEAAIKAYQSVGFQIVKTYKCFSGDLNPQASTDFNLKEINIKTLDWELLPNQHLYSWDNQKETVLKGDYNVFQVFQDDQPESFFIIHPEDGYIPQLEVLNNSSIGWKRLFSAIRQVSKTIRINNVDDRLKEKIEQLNLIGLKNPIDQYEMALKIE